MFRLKINNLKASDYKRKTVREACRGIIIDKDRILMVKTSKGDYKFPGGGIEDGESYGEALFREESEETGYIIGNNTSLAGTVVEKRQDYEVEDSIFEMISYYHFCDVCSNESMQKLDDYELKQDFKPIWVKIEHAYRENLEILNNSLDKNDWVERETLVLKVLAELI